MFNELEVTTQLTLKMVIDNQRYVHHENLKNMKTTEKKTEKQFDAVKFMRQQRDILSKKLSKMTKVEILEYFRKRKTELTIKPSA